MSASYITDSEGNVVYPKTLAKCVNKGGSTLEEYLNDVEDATLIKPTAQGTDIQLKDASDMNVQELHLYGKTEQKTTKGIQLLNLKDAKGGTGDGVTYTPNGDGSFKKTGTATGQIGNIWLKGGYYSDWENRTPIITLEVGKSYYIKDCAIFQGQTNIASGSRYTIINVTEEKYPGGIKITGIRNTGFTLNKTYNEVIYPIIAESSTAIEWEEYTGGQPSPSPDYPQEIKPCENPTISISGKNKAKEYEVNKTNKPYTTILNIDADLEANKEYSLSFIATKGLWFYFNENLFAYDMKQATGDYQTIKLKTVATLSKDNPNQFNKSLQKWIILKTDAKNTVVADFDKVQLEEGNVGTAYEEYKEIQSAQQTCELNGIAAIRDELIVRADGTGTLIQRFAKESVKFNKLIESQDCAGRYVIFNYLKNHYKSVPKCLCNIANRADWGEPVYKKWVFSLAEHTVYISPPKGSGYTVDTLKEYLANADVMVMGEIKEPIVNELSSEEVQKILALHTNKPNTTIWNDQNADMQITYVADTKKYIDDKFEELSEAITTSTTIDSLDTSN